MRASPSSCRRISPTPSGASTGARRAAPTAKIVACGGLMIAENADAMHARLEIADRALYCRLSFRSCPLGEVALSREIAVSVLLSALRITGGSGRRARPRRRCGRSEMRSRDRVRGRNALQRRRPGLDDRSSASSSVRLLRPHLLRSHSASDSARCATSAGQATIGAQSRADPMACAIGSGTRRARPCALDVARHDAAMRAGALDVARSMPASPARRRASGVTTVPPGSRAGP